jgi:hypothetical protein
MAVQMGLDGGRVWVRFGEVPFLTLHLGLCKHPFGSIPDSF